MEIIMLYITLAVAYKALTIKVKRCKGMLQLSVDEAREALITLKRQKFDKLIFRCSVNVERIALHDLPGFIDGLYICHYDTTDSGVLRT
jgi:hypothetical protein